MELAFALEAWYSNKEENSINEHVEFPRVYLNLFTIFIFAYVTDEGHRSDRNVFTF